MDDPLRIIAADLGVFLTAEARGFGYDDRAIRYAVRTGEWHRVRRGAYVPGDVWRDADRVGKHLIRARAVHRSYGDRVAFSHTTAALLHGLAVWGVDLDRVHVTRLDGGAGRAEKDVVHHDAFCLAPEDVVRADGRLLTAPARAALETGALASSESALVVLDQLLFRGLGTPTDIGNAYEVIQRWPSTRHLQIAVRMADAGAQSVGESRSRWMFRCRGIPLPELQYVVRDEHGRHLGTTDFAWPWLRTLGEFDGKQKYDRLLRPGQRPGDAVFEEKVREDALRHTTGFGMVRLVWSDLSRPEEACQRLLRSFSVAA